MKLIFGVYNRVYLLTILDNIKLVIISVAMIIRLIIIHTLNNNIVIKIGIIIHIVDNHIKCFCILINVNSKGIIINIYISSVLNHFHERLFIKFEMNSSLFISLLGVNSI